ncbi:thymidylate synthase/pyrimidine hydroxymethylase-like protein [Alishewanella phage vB_AspM_Slicko01]|nr:thymidylate synthase/pyrimidine hydroxymethylase-like protein [Alishewanella phage vB_AspM_Slicko01]
MEFYGEQGYLDLLKEVLTNGVDVPNERTKTTCRTMFDAKLIIEEGESFTVTHRTAPLRLAFEELWFFLRGKTDTKILERNKVTFWRGNTTREFLDDRGLSHLPEGSLGHAYSMQYRNSGGGFVDENFDRLDYTGKDQLADLVAGLIADPYGRRHLVNLWNPNQLKLMPLTPCWYGFQIVVLPSASGDVLHMKLLNRSCDVPFGLLFAVQQYRLFQQALAKLLKCKLGKLSADFSNMHVYDNQMEYAAEIVERSIIQNGEVIITKELNTLEDLLSIAWSDIFVNNHHADLRPFKAKRPLMVV